MQKSISFFVAFLIFTLSFGQKTTVAIKTLRTVYQRGYNGNSRSVEQAKIEDFVTNKFVNTRKFDIVDRASLNELQSEKDLQKTDEFNDGQVIEQSKTLGAEYLVGIYISSLDITRTGTTTYIYGCKMTFSIKIMDIATSQIIATEIFSGTSGQGLFNFISSGDAAVEKCLTIISPKIDVFIKSNFATKASIANIEESDASGAAIKILISAGSANGVSIGENFRVMESLELNVDGKKMFRNKEVGALQIVSIEDENFSICTVIKGGADIAKKKTEGKRLQVIAQN